MAQGARCTARFREEFPKVEFFDPPLTIFCSRAVCVGTHVHLVPALKLSRHHVSGPVVSEDEAYSPMANEPLKGDALLVLVYRQMRVLTGNHPDLDDLAQSAIEQVLRSRFEGRSKFSTFTYAVCYRVWLKHLRSFYRWFRQIDVSRTQLVDPHSLTTELDRAELRERVHCALSAIPAKQRAVILLHDIEELDAEEVALIVDTNLGTVRSRLRDGRKTLGQKLARDPYFGDNAFRDKP
jgi:RNA polymerase sigma factor (sigma-70 family)